jgi:carboxypeptidase Q
MKFYSLFLFVLLTGFSVKAQNDSTVVKSIYDEVLSNGQAYDNLKVLCTAVGHRLSGSPAADKAVIWGANTLRAAGADTVYLQEVQVPVWVRGNKEVVRVSSGKMLRPLHACSLGGSIGTNGLLNAEVIEVLGVEELLKLTKKEVKGKIVFFNKPMDPRKISTFEAYGACVDQRHAGAGEAAKLGALAVLVRSMSLAIDEHPHTGSMSYPEGAERIPALAISTLDANWLHKELANGKQGDIKVGIESNCEFKGYKTSYNVIGELRGNKNPEQIMVVGGHLDSWDKGQGAHDDGAGCVQSIETLRLFKTLGIRPNNTLRVILFMNEENGNMGGKTYAKAVNTAQEKHVLAFESDRGGFTPRGVHMDANLENIKAIAAFKSMLEHYGLHVFEKGYSGVDISPLKHGEGSFNPDIMMLGLLPDSQRYFDYHHADTDVIEAVNPRELHLGAGAMAALVYLIDKTFQFK